MKKSLIAAAVVAALPAFAQAQTNVTMYGIADASVNVIKLDSGSRNAIMVQSGDQSISRWGVRGSEDLGNGMKAVFQFEAGVTIDNGVSDAAGFFQRTAQVGLTGGFGTIKLGRGYTPAFRMVGTWDAFSYGMYGNMLTATIPTSTGGADIAQTRFSNGIYYDSPSFGGISVQAAYSAGENTSKALPGSAGAGMDIAVGYKGGPLHVGGYYEQVKDNTAAGNKVKRYGIGGGYDFGGFKLVAGYGESKNEAIAVNPKHNSAHIGGIVNVGGGKLMAQVMRLDHKSAQDDRAIAFGIGYSYPLSKRTDVYAQLGMTRNKDAGTFGLRTSQTSYLPTVAGGDPRGFGVGVRHIF